MYEVNWLPRTEQQIGMIVLESKFDLAVLETMRKINRWLSNWPLLMGEERTSSLHRWFCTERISVEFEVIEDDKRVFVHSVGYFRD